MKKLGIMIIALALVTVFTQCKKEQPEGGDTPTLEGETRHISLSLYSGQGGRYVVTPIDAQDIAPVNFELGDKIQVAYNGKYVGELSCTDLTEATDIHGHHYGIFEGNITITKSGDQPLHFYFMGNRTPVVNANNDKLTIDISNQTAAAGGLPVISYAPSLQNYADDVTSYSVQYNWLKNQCALVKFRMENIYDMSANTLDNNEYALYTTDKDITLYGLENEVTVDLTQSGEAQFGWRSNDANGSIKLFQPASSPEHPDSASMVRFAIIHHADYTSVTEGGLDVPFDPATDNYGFYGTYKIAHNVVQNEYYDGAKLDLVWHSGAFSISANQQVVFSRGNVQYADHSSVTRPARTWRFAKHQYDYVGGKLGLSSNAPRQGNVVLTEDVNNEYMSDNRQIGGDSYSGWIDLFGWGTGDRPTLTSALNTNYTGNVYNVLNPSDPYYWGNYPYYHDFGENNLVNSGKPNNTTWWETLSGDEWKYLVDSRDDHDSRVGYGRIKVSDDEYVNGLVLLPDNWSASYSTSTYLFMGTSWGDHNFTSNSFESVAAWMEMEAYGAVFLPAAGYRQESSVNHEYDGGTSNDQNRGCYWASDLQGHDAAWGVGFGVASGANLLGDGINAKVGYAPDNGRSVRLVHRL